jgi:hypothetical protein
LFFRIFYYLIILQLVFFEKVFASIYTFDYLYEVSSIFLKSNRNYFTKINNEAISPNKINIKKNILAFHIKSNKNNYITIGFGNIVFPNSKFEHLNITNAYYHLFYQNKLVNNSIHAGVSFNNPLYKKTFSYSVGVNYLINYYIFTDFVNYSLYDFNNKYRKIYPGVEYKVSINYHLYKDALVSIFVGQSFTKISIQNIQIYNGIAFYLETKNKKTNNIGCSFIVKSM